MHSDDAFVIRLTYYLLKFIV